MSRGLQPARSPAPARMHYKTSTTTAVASSSGFLSSQNAGGIAGLPLSTEAAIVEIEDKKAVPAVGGGDFDCGACGIVDCSKGPAYGPLFCAVGYDPP